MNHEVEIAKEKVKADKILIKRKLALGKTGVDVWKMQRQV